MNKKNWLLMLLACVVVFTSLNSCKKSNDSEEDTVQEWFKSSSIDGDKRNGAASFTIGKTAYVVTGLLNNNTRANDTWAFNSETKAWTRLADFPGVARNLAVAFSIGTKGYVGTGFDGTARLTDFYEYDSANNTWKEIASFPAEARAEATGFALNGKGYVGFGATGTDKELKDIYEYNPTTDEWKSAIGFPGDKRKNGFAFIIGDKAYVGGGVESNNYPADFFSFDGTKWTKLNDLNRKDNSYTYDLTRHSASTLVIGGSAYVIGGVKGALTNTVWKYNPTTDVWTSDNKGITVARQNAVSFYFGGNSGYVSTGINGSNRLDDTWEFIPVK